MDPEQIYQEVLAEEQKKGSAAPVAEGRSREYKHVRRKRLYALT